MEDDFSYNGVGSTSLNLYIKENILNQIGLIPKTRDAVIESEDIEGEIYQGSVFQEHEFNLECVLSCSSESEQDEKLLEIAELFWVDAPKRLIIPHHPDRYLECILNGDIEYTLTPFYNPLSIPLLAPDPFWYSVGEYFIEIDSEDTLVYPEPIINGGGFSTPFSLNLSRSGGLVLNNPTITLNGVDMTYNGSIAPGDQLVINTMNKTAKIGSEEGGGYANALKDYNKLFPLLSVGLNYISVPVGGLIEITYRRRWK
jgi:phage-related protein